MQRLHKQHIYSLLLQRNLTLALKSDSSFVLKRANSSTSPISESDESSSKNAGEHAEYAKFPGGRQWEFRAGAMARLASGSVVLSTDEDNAILGTVVCKYTQKLSNEEELLKAVEEEEQKQAECSNLEEDELNKEEMNENVVEQEGSFMDEDFKEVGRSSKKQREAKSTTANSIGSNADSIQGLPLTVDFRQSAAALGRIPMNYFRREMNNSDQDVAISRVIDRSIRPTIPSNFPCRTHIVCKPLALDADIGDPVVMGINAAAAALAVSPVPQHCLVAAARVGIIDGKIVVNPPREKLKNSSLDLILSGTTTVERKKRKNKSTDEIDHVLMVEMEGKEVEAEQFVECINRGFGEIRLIQSSIQRLVNAVGHEKYNFSDDEFSVDLLQRVAVCEGAVEAILKEHSHDKSSRKEAIENVFQGWRLLMNRQPHQYNESMLRSAFTKIVTSVHRKVVLETGVRADGRLPNEFRPIKCRVNLYRKLHGSALFQRGQSQVLSTVTFDSPQAAFHPDAIAQLLGAQRKKSFMLHYEFPQFATNEIDGPNYGSNRREIGHGLLAEKALRQVIPEEFPYTIRLACQVLESNGSTSMASVCAGSMALFDSGVPLLANHVAGLAIGLLTDKGDNVGELILRGENAENAVNQQDSNSANQRFPEKYLLLTDLAGFEDFSGDMDFKIAGTSRGFTAMQMDLKICGISLKVFREALQRGQVGIEHVLSLMREEIAEPRSEFKESVPVLELMQLPIYKRPILFRSGAYNAKLIESETGVKVTSEDDANVLLFAPNQECLVKAKALIEKLTQEQQDEHYQFGTFYKAEIVRILEGGIHVALKEGGRNIWMRNADLSSAPGHKNAHALGFQVGQKISVQYFGRDQHSGQHRLTRKTLQIVDPPVQNLFRTQDKQISSEKEVLKPNASSEKQQKETIESS